MIEITNEGYAIVSEDTHIGKWVKEHKRLDFDQNMLPYVYKYLKPTDTILDIGANIGAYAFGMLKKIPKGKLICFEPSEEAFNCLKLNLNGFNNVELINKAVGLLNGKVKIIQENDNIGMNYCEESNEGIDIVSIDSLDLAPNFIKIDVEGFEIAVLNGAIKTINKYKPTMLIEVNEHTLKRRGLTKDDLLLTIDSLGYTFKNIYPQQGITDDQFDVICLPKN